MTGSEQQEPKAVLCDQKCWQYQEHRRHQQDQSASHTERLMEAVGVRTRPVAGVAVGTCDVRRDSSVLPGGVCLSPTQKIDGWKV